MVKAVKAAQLADQVRDYIAEWAAQELPGLFFSITQVTLSPDTQQATAWVDILQPEKSSLIMRRLQQSSPRFQRALHQKMRRRIVPHVSFKLDDQVALENHFDQLLKG